jgi:chromosome partitioning protein
MAGYSIQKVMNIYGVEVPRNSIILAEKMGKIPQSTRETRGAIKARAWDIQDLPAIGEKYGFLDKLKAPMSVAVFSTKGGVLKTTLALNIARMAALHNIRTCVVGLDIQGDITKALGFSNEVDEESDLDTAMEQLQSYPTLADMFLKRAQLSDIVQHSPELPTLSVIPESSGLAALDTGLTTQPKREHWLKDNVIAPLKEQFDLIIMDCSPSWSQIISNALVACDALISPLETKINHYRNYPDFKAFIAEFDRVMGLDYEKIPVPTRFNSTRKLCVEIRNWYLGNVAGCTSGVVREAITGEEAMSMCLSLPEFAPTSVAAAEMRDLLGEIWSRLQVRSERVAGERQNYATVKATVSAVKRG